MYIEKRAIVEGILYEDDEIQLLKTSTSAKKAMLYLQLTPKAKVNDEVIVNVTSTELKLGTGGMDFVTHVLRSLPKENLIQNGHIMKARYLPNQLSVLAVEAQESKYHYLFKQPFSLEGKKILIGELHSMIPICFWAMDFLKKDGKMVVIISDEASIPLSVSNHVRTLNQDERFLTITIGQAFGGTYEAINLHTALQFASEVLKGDVIFVTLGPGVVGSGTSYGFSGVEQAAWANTVGSLNGVPVWIPRLSETDKRERHRGISHHTFTSMIKFTYAQSILPLPTVNGEIGEKIKKQVEEICEKHHVQWVLKDPLEEVMKHCLSKSSIPLQTMGRQYKDDPLFFLGVTAAIKWLLDSSEN